MSDELEYCECCDVTSDDVELCDVDGKLLCSECERKHVEEKQKDELEETVMALAAKHGWRQSRNGWHRAETGTIYIELRRDQDDEMETLKVRIADHPTAHCSEDISLVIASGSEGFNDHNIEILERRLSREFVANA